MLTKMAHFHSLLRSLFYSLPLSFSTLFFIARQPTDDCFATFVTHGNNVMPHITVELKTPLGWPRLFLITKHTIGVFSPAAPQRTSNCGSFSVLCYLRNDNLSSQIERVLIKSFYINKRGFAIEPLSAILHFI